MSLFPDPCGTKQCHVGVSLPENTYTSTFSHVIIDDSHTTLPLSTVSRSNTTGDKETD